MYSTAFSLDAYSLWRPQNHYTQRVHEEASSQGQNHHQNHNHVLGNGHAQGAINLQNLNNLNLRLFCPQNRRQNLPVEANQYAPPLSAYLTEECGPSAVYTEYNTTKQLAVVTGSTDVPLLSPHLLRRLQTLRRIRATGYTKIAPIGIGRTMAQIDSEAQVEDEDSQYIQENLVQGSTHAETLTDLAAVNNNRSNVVNLDSATSMIPNDNILGIEHDLDAQVVDADASEVYSDDLDGHHESIGHDGFMAEDVEYQNDHSLGSETASGPRSGPLSGSSVLGHSLLSGSTSGTILTGNVLACDDSDMDMAIEE